MLYYGGAARKHRTETQPRTNVLVQESVSFLASTCSGIGLSLVFVGSGSFLQLRHAVGIKVN